jgi:hypothetical protein
MRVACLFLSAGLLATTAAASDFAGTWKRDDSQTKLIPPPTVTIEPKGAGWHVGWSTGPDYEVIPDGSEHPVTGNNIFQTEVSRRVDARTLEQDGKRGGKDAGKIVWTVSADGRELHQHTDGTYPNGASYRNDSYYRLVKGGGGADPFTGVWENQPERTRFSFPQVYTIRDIDNGIEFQSSSGLSYTAHFDGKETPIGGGSGGTVALTKLDDRTIRVVIKRRDGAIASATTLTFAGRKLTDNVEMPTSGGGSFRSITVFERQ